MDFLLDRQNIFKDLDPQVLDSLQEEARIERVQTKDILFREGEVLGRVYFAKSGQYALYKLSHSGEKRIIFTLGPGEVLNYPEPHPRPMSISCQALKGGQLISFSQEALVEAMKKDPSLALGALDLYNLRLRRLYRQLKNASGSIRLDKRIAAKLWKLSRDYPLDHPLGTAIDMNLSMTLLAQHLGASRESVSRQAKRLMDQDLVLYQQSTWIIPNRKKLEAYFRP
ncbi:MAG: Crp/Fnr family transcriptional regulator [Tissierellia bacterium]|nr:Crp/Fnr family transcriptional regulator [Tissierellia bacterium]